MCTWEGSGISPTGNDRALILAHELVIKIQHQREVPSTVTGGLGTLVWLCSLVLILAHELIYGSRSSDPSGPKACCTGATPVIATGVTTRKGELKPELVVKPSP